MSAKLPSVAFLGLGNMGGRMALNLARAGYPVQGYDIDVRRQQERATQGESVPARSLAGIVAETDLLLTSLPGPEQIRELAFGDDGILLSPRDGLTWIDFSTLDVDTGLSVHRACASAGVTMIDAPVTGGVKRADDVTLTMPVADHDRRIALCFQ